jgi:hypothetical protein
VLGLVRIGASLSDALDFFVSLLPSSAQILFCEMHSFAYVYLKVDVDRGMQTL